MSSNPAEVEHPDVPEGDGRDQRGIRGSAGVARFVTLSQQLLAVGAVIAVLAPAANVVSLEVVPRPGAGDATAAPGAPIRDRHQGGADEKTLGPGGSGADSGGDSVPSGPGTGGTDAGGADADSTADARPGRVETAPVEPTVSEYAMAAAQTGTGDAQGFTQRRTRANRVLSEPQPVTGYGAVGVTWRSGADLDEHDIEVSFRTRTDGSWGDWKPVEYHAAHGPDTPSAGVRPGTDVLLVGEVDEVQARAVLAPGVAAPRDLTLSVVEPGQGETELQDPAIDTGALDANAASPAAAEAGDTDAEDAGAESSGAIALQAAEVTRKPKIFSRAQWGADERLRDRGSLRYYEVHAGFVHHTVNANHYSRAQVPGIIRGIYAYHTQSRGWSDVGYNFLVDRFGRIWEGRAGGVDRPVVGAHTLGYNDYAFAMSAIGNFETARPSRALVQAYGKLMAWKLSLHGVDATDKRQQVGSRTFPAISGHRDAGSTACPGRHLYAKLPEIRRLAGEYQAAWDGRERFTNVVGTRHADVLLRRASDKRGFVLPTKGLLRWARSRTVGTGWRGYDVAAATPDVTGDDVPDLVVRNAASGRGGVRPGRTDGTFGPLTARTRVFAGFDQVTPAGDLDGDGRHDLVARNPRSGRLVLFRGDGDGGFRRSRLHPHWGRYTLTAATGDLDGDGNRDLLARDRRGRLWLHPGTGIGKLRARVRVPGDWGRYDLLSGYGDVTGDDRGDLYARNAETGKGFVFPGRGDGTFGHWQGPFGKVAGLRSVSLVDVRGSDDPDLLGIAGDRLRVSTHRGTYNTGSLIGVRRKFAAADTLLNVGDWDGDGHDDIVIRSRVSHRLQLFRGLGKGEFAKKKVIDRGDWSDRRLLAAVGDVTGDGHPDLMSAARGGPMMIHPGRPGGLAPSYVAHSAIRADVQLGLGRWDADGAPDNLFREGNSLFWYAGNGPGGLTGRPHRLGTDLSAYDRVLSPGNIYGGRRPDLVVRKRSDGTLWVLRGLRNGFGTPRFLAEGYGGYDLMG